MRGHDSGPHGSTTLNKIVMNSMENIYVYLNCAIDSGDNDAVAVDGIRQFQ